MADLSVTAASVVPSANVARSIKTAAEAIDAGETVAVDSSGELILTDATDTTKIDVVGMAICSAADGQPCTYARIDAALVLGTAVTNGAPIYLSETPGKITITLADLTTGSTPVICGTGDGTSTIEWDATNAMVGTAVS